MLPARQMSDAPSEIEAYYFMSLQLLVSNEHTCMETKHFSLRASSFILFHFKFNDPLTHSAKITARHQSVLRRSVDFKIHEDLSDTNRLIRYRSWLP